MKQKTPKEMKIKSRIRSVIIVILIILIVLFIGIYVVFIPKPDTIATKNLPENVMIIKEDNYYACQSGFDCAGYSTAYVLRHFGEQVQGASLYNDMQYKMGNTGVYLTGLTKTIKDYGYKSHCYTGSLDTIKAQLAKGVPVIALITIEYRGNTGLHYVAVIGYDDMYFYMADSTRANANVFGEKQYNRKVTYEEFEDLLDIKKYGAKNIYIVSEK